MGRASVCDHLGGMEEVKVVVVMRRVMMMMMMMVVVLHKSYLHLWSS